MDRRKLKRCDVPDCAAKQSRGVICQRHWMTLPRKFQTALYDAERHGLDSDFFMAVRACAIGRILVLSQRGIAASSFMLDALQRRQRVFSESGGTVDPLEGLIKNGQSR